MIDVAEAAGVSIATVSAFINGTANVSAELTQRIELAIRRSATSATPSPAA